MISLFKDNLGLSLIFMTISVAHYMVVRKLKSVSTFQAIFVSVLAAPLLFMEGLFAIAVVIGGVLYKLVLLLGGVDLAQFNQEVDDIAEYINNDDSGG